MTGDGAACAVGGMPAPFLVHTEFIDLLELSVFATPFQPLLTAFPFRFRYVPGLISGPSDLAAYRHPVDQ